MRVDLFDFELPVERIAQRPASPRDSARLLDIEGDALADRTIGDLPALLRAGDLLVFNDTRVVPARLTGTRHGGAGRSDVRCEALLVRRLGDGLWRCFARPGKRLRVGDTMSFGDGLAATIRAKAADGTVDIAFGLDDAALMAALDSHGAIPLPPYIRGGVADESDHDDYQTIHGRVAGAVAASTAGLHFTPGLMTALDHAGIARTTITLHVGAGTFQPVRGDDTDDHVMHAEWASIGQDAAEAIARARREGGRVVAVGTTSLRILESVATANDGRVVPWSGDTSIFIVPGYRFAVVDLLLTNFHLPRSTLFMLASAFAGLDRMRSAYAHAIADNYRFYSYGDACLLHRSTAS